MVPHFMLPLRGQVELPAELPAEQPLKNCAAASPTGERIDSNIFCKTSLQMPATGKNVS